MNHKEIYDLNILSESLISNDETFQQACDDDLMRRLALDDERSFDSIFKLYYKDLLLYAGSYLRERQVCEDIFNPYSCIYGMTGKHCLWGDR